MNNKTLIKNATIVNEGASTISDILIEGQIISKIDKEINIEGRKDFLDAGGEEFNYIPCLNYRKDWVKALNHLSKK